MGKLVSLEHKFSYKKWYFHCYNVGVCGFLVYLVMGLPELECIRRGQAIHLHDPGKLHPLIAHLFEHRRPWTPEERELGDRHDILGVEYLQSLNLDEFLEPEVLKLANDAQLFHHTPFVDGGTKIPHIGRVTAVVDAYNGMIEDRGYKESKTFEQARNEIRLHTGSKYDPEIVDVFLSQVEPLLVFEPVQFESGITTPRKVGKRAAGIREQRQ